MFTTLMVSVEIKSAFQASPYCGSGGGKEIENNKVRDGKREREGGGGQKEKEEGGKEREGERQREREDGRMSEIAVTRACAHAQERERARESGHWR